MRILMALARLNKAGGVEQYIVSVLPELKHQGVEIVFYTELPPENNNQYLTALKRYGFEVHYPRLGSIPIYYWRWVSDLLLVALLPITITIILLDWIVRGRSLRRSIGGLQGRLNNTIGRRTPERFLSLPNSITLSWLWIRHRPDVLHVLRVDTINTLRWGLRKQIPLVYTEALEPTGDAYYPQLSCYYRDLERLADRIPAIITQSERVKKSIERRWHVRQNVHVIPWAVAVPETMTKDNDKHPGVITFGSAGRLSSEKKVDDFLRAAQLLLLEYPDGIRFVIAGDGPDAQRLHQMTSELGMAHRVRFTGHYNLSSLAAIFAMFDIFVISSLTEGAPLAVIEAMAYGKPVVATDVAGTGELIKDGITGFLVPPEDPKQLADTCRRFIINPSLAIEMAIGATQRYRQLYAPAAGANSLRALYQEVGSINTLHR